MTTRRHTEVSSACCRTLAILQQSSTAWPFGPVRGGRLFQMSSISVRRRSTSEMPDRIPKNPSGPKHIYAPWKLHGNPMEFPWSANMSGPTGFFDRARGRDHRILSTTFFRKLLRSFRKSCRLRHTPVSVPDANFTA